MSEILTPTDTAPQGQGVTTEELAALARAWKKLTPEERAARLQAACGMFAGGTRSLEDFLREKHEEIDREEAEWSARRQEAQDSGK
jgi:hypothetical protein